MYVLYLGERLSQFCTPCTVGEAELQTLTDSPPEIRLIIWSSLSLSLPLSLSPLLKGRILLRCTGLKMATYRVLLDIQQQAGHALVSRHLEDGVPPAQFQSVVFHRRRSHHQPSSSVGLSTGREVKWQQAGQAVTALH